MGHGRAGVFRCWRRQCLKKPQSVVAVLIIVLFICIGFFYLTHTEQTPERSVKVYVVEEHHEVLRYWYHETVIGNLPRNGNTLIHIDAHSDLAPPEPFDGFPFFTWPQGEPQVYTMLQANDMFIQAAISIGLIDHVIWVYPSWDTSLGPASEVYRLDLGQRKMNDTISGRKGFCECHTVLSQNGKDVDPKPECAFTSRERSELGDIEMFRKDCKLMKSIIVEKIVEDVALEVFAKGIWRKTPPKSVMLDIDEDYFGCESGALSLLNAGTPWQVAQKIDQVLDELICPKHVVHEELADKIIKEYVKDYIRLCEMRSDKEKCDKSVNALRMKVDKHISEAFVHTPGMFCDDTEKEANLQMANILPLFHMLTLQQLEAILKLGFCMTTSPATLGFDEGRVSYELCHGYNVPNETVVKLYTPEKPEINDRMTKLHAMLFNLTALNPKIVTLCRSGRDGYTPRHLLNYIEDGILDFFRHPPHPDVLQYSLYFDDNLLGGENGWEGRYKPL